MTVWQVGLIVGAIVCAMYVLRARSNGHEPALQSGVNVFLASGAAVAAVRLIYVAWTATDTDFEPFGSDDRVYVVLGGVALFWVSAAEVFRQYRSVDAVTPMTSGSAAQTHPPQVPQP